MSPHGKFRPAPRKGTATVIAAGIQRARPFPGRLATVVLALLLAPACADPSPPAEVQANLASEGPLRAPNGVVSSANEISSRVGAEVMRAGGNALDAAIAVGFALAVTHPSAGNVGGGGFMIIRTPDGDHGRRLP